MAAASADSLNDVHREVKNLAYRLEQVEAKLGIAYNSNIGEQGWMESHRPAPKHAGRKCSS